MKGEADGPGICVGLPSGEDGLSQTSRGETPPPLPPASAWAGHTIAKLLAAFSLICVRAQDCSVGLARGSPNRLTTFAITKKTSSEVSNLSAFPDLPVFKLSDCQAFTFFICQVSGASSFRVFKFQVPRFSGFQVFGFLMFPSFRFPSFQVLNFQVFEF